MLRGVEERPVRVLITGGAGFIGSNLVRWILDARPGWEIANLDLLTYAGSLENLQGVLDHPLHRFVQGDICDRALVRDLVGGEHESVSGPVDLIIHLAAESHVDRSIASDEPFVRTNVLGTQVLLSEGRSAGVRRFVQVGTDEVYGELPWVDPEEIDPVSGEPRWRPGADGRNPPRDGFREEDPLLPRSPYSASKAAADLLALSYLSTFGPASSEGGMDVLVTRCSNNYGPRQHGEKLIPTLVRNALGGHDLPLYGDGLYIRDWLHVEDHCRGLVAVAEAGLAGRVYNFGGAGERTNRQIARAVLESMGTHCAPRIGSVADRKGHDRRYAVNFSRAVRELDWAPSVTFEEGLRRTVAWYSENRGRLRTCDSGEA